MMKCIGETIPELDIQSIPLSHRAKPQCAPTPKVHAGQPCNWIRAHTTAKGALKATLATVTRMQLQIRRWLHARSLVRRRMQVHTLQRLWVACEIFKHNSHTDEPCTCVCNISDGPGLVEVRSVARTTHGNRRSIKGGEKGRAHFVLTKHTDQRAGRNQRRWGERV